MEGLIVFVLVASTLGIVWHAHRGERTGYIEGAMLRSFGRRRRLRLSVRRVRSGGEPRVQISGLVSTVYRSASVSPDEAREWAETLERFEARRCGGFEITPDYEMGDSDQMLVVFPLDFNRYRLRLILDRAQAEAAGRCLRAAAQPKK